MTPNNYFRREEARCVLGTEPQSGGSLGCDPRSREGKPGLQGLVAHVQKSDFHLEMYAEPSKDFHQGNSTVRISVKKGMYITT